MSAVTVGVSVLTGIVFGIVPAWLASRTDVVTALKSQARGSSSGRRQHRVRHALVIAEVSLALVLLTFGFTLGIRAPGHIGQKISFSSISRKHSLAVSSW